MTGDVSDDSRTNWSGEPRVVMWFLSPPKMRLCRHNFYHMAYSPGAVRRAQCFEYKRGIVTWLEYVPLEGLHDAGA
jgi:hypothetical protein